MRSAFSTEATPRYSGNRGALFGLAFKTGLLTVFTLGIYRFWAKTRIRRYVWSSSSLDGDALEYTGTGLEKFLGFLVAVVVLAVYLGLVQLALFYLGLHFVFDPQTEADVLMQMGVFYISFFAVLPLMLFARYRSRRYMLARTRFRGIRFGMDNAAWGYVWRALLHGFLSVLTLGLLLPRQTFSLAKYKNDRSHYGDKSFVQGGRWTALYPAMAGFLLPVAVLVLFAALIVMSARNGGAADSPLIAFLPILTMISGGFAYVYYRVNTFRYLTSHTTLGGAVAFRAEPRTGRVIGIYAIGSLAAGLIGAVVFAVVTAAVAAVMGGVVGAGQAPSVLGFALVAAMYLGAFALIGALILVYFTQPLIAHVTETLRVLNPGALDTVGQRRSDPGADAEGFAEALDVGGAL